MFFTNKTNTNNDSVTNSNTLERITLLENNMLQLIENNKFLMQRVNYLENALSDSHQRLEKRITDFTDIWNPFMTSTMNRIKDELAETVETTIKSNVESCVKSTIDSEIKSSINSEIQTVTDKLQTLQTKFDDTNIEGLRLVGFSNKEIIADPKFTFMKKGGLLHYQENDIGHVCGYIGNGVILILLLETFKQLHNIYNFKICNIIYLEHSRFFDENCKELQVISSGTDYIREPNNYVHIKNNGNTGTPPTNFNKKFLKKLLNILDKLNIKLVYNDSELNDRGELLRDLIMS